MSKTIKLNIQIRNMDTKEFFKRVIEDVILEDESEMVVKQLYVIGDQLSGVQATCQIKEDLSYKVLLFSKMTKVGETEYISEGPAIVRATIDNIRYSFAIQRVEEARKAEKIGFIKRFFGK